MEFKSSLTMDEAVEQLRIQLSGILCYKKADDYTVDDECGGLYRVQLWKDGLLGRNISFLTVTLDNLNGYLRVHAFGEGKSGEDMVHELVKAFGDTIIHD